MKIYKVRDDSGYTYDRAYDMMVSLSKDSETAAGDMKPLLSTLINLIRKFEGVEHKGFNDNFIFRPYLLMT